MSRSLHVAVAQPTCWDDAVERNAVEHGALIRRSGARLVVFPELSLTGYHFEAPRIAPDDEVLAPLVDACRAAQAIALVGAPVTEGGDTRIAMLRVDASGGSVAYRKGHLGSPEQARFAPGDGPTVTTVDGWRVGLGICKDTDVIAHIEGVAALKIDLYAAGLVHHDHELAEQEARATRIARTCDSFVAFASFAGATGEGFTHTAGNSSIWDHQGQLLTRTDDRAGQVTSAVLHR